MKLGRVIFILSLVCILSVGYFYFFHISPIFVQKPVLEKPGVVQDTNVGSAQVVYILNELDAYKLHEDPVSKEKPLIEVVILDLSKTFFITVKDNNIKETTETSNPDIRIKGNLVDINNLLLQEDFETAIVDSFMDGNLQIEILADEKTLALKGYKSIYDKLSPNLNQITGEVVQNLNPVEYTKASQLIFLLMASIIIGLVIEKI